jgi:hypothetical protein
VYDLKDLFNIDPSRVWFRAINTFIPGLHLPIIAHPDLYGPLLLVLLLPQVWTNIFGTPSMFYITFSFISI